MIQIVERKLGRERAYGLAWTDELIEVDPRQTPRDYLGTVIHEALHQVFPEKSESEVSRGAQTLTRLLWGVGYRRVKGGGRGVNGLTLKLERTIRRLGGRSRGVRLKAKGKRPSGRRG